MALFYDEATHVAITPRLPIALYTLEALGKYDVQLWPYDSE